VQIYIKFFSNQDYIKLKTLQVGHFATLIVAKLLMDQLVNYRYPKGNSGFKNQTPQLLPTANLDFCLESESVPDPDVAG
jgi:hypothetical protein